MCDNFKPIRDDWDSILSEEEKAVLADANDQLRRCLKDKKSCQTGTGILKTRLKKNRQVLVTWRTEGEMMIFQRGDYVHIIRKVHAKR
jgi:hypothetical protein